MSLTDSLDDNFLWGAATAAHQVEGGTVNDWSRWEQQAAGTLAAEGPDEYGTIPAWDAVRAEATDPSNYVSGSAVDHYGRYEADIELLASLGLNAYRFSIEWSRVQPEPGAFDEAAIEHYRDVLATLDEHGVTPVLTLWHFTNPQWFVDQGGWTAPDAVDDFLAYVERMVAEFGDDVDYWITLNEPVGYVWHTFGEGAWLDRTTGIRPLYRAWKNMIAAHRGAYAAITDARPDALAGTANNVSYFEPYRGRAVNRVVARALRELEHGLFLDRTAGCQDFLGVNYYRHRQVDYRLRSDDHPESDLGWELSPAGFSAVVRQLHDRYEKPIFVTEHGLADRGDEHRGAYIEASVAALDDVAAAGVPVMGYLHWSLLDNFEWSKGRWPRFGLVAVDYDDLSRSVRPSALAYASLVGERRGITPPILQSSRVRSPPAE